MHSRFGRLEKFNGNADKFPLFIKKFQALVYGLGKDYRLVMQQRKPFNQMLYSTMDEPYEYDASEDESEEKLHGDQK